MSKKISDLDVLVVGGGIGGLAAACALAQRGARVTVLEQAAEIAEVGAGLQVSPNGLAVLSALGLAGALEASGAVLGDSVELKDYRGAGVVALDLTQLSPQKYYFVHRADLIDVLAAGARAAGVQIRLLKHVERVEDGPRPKVFLREGEVREADLVIGADGVHSRLRSALNGAEEPYFTGNVAWRAVVPNTFGRAREVRVHMGPHRHVVSYPLRGGAAVNIVAVEERRAWMEESWTAPADVAELRETFADFSPEVREMLGAVQSAKVWGLFKHDVAQNWHGTGLALLGDAAHPTLPFLAQGAVMALEDAWVLAEALERADNVPQGLAAYQARRKTRASKVVDTATGNAWKYHLSFPPMRFAAHTALRLGGAVAPGVMLRQFDWLYRHDVTRN